MNPSSNPKKRWFYLILGAVTMLCTGTIYGWSALKVPLAEAFGWQPSWLTLAYALAFCAFCAGNAVGSLLQNKIGFRATMLLSGLLIFGGYALLSTLDGSTILLLYVYYSLLVGGGIGLSYPLLLTWITNWFVDMQGFCSGVLTMGFGCSALLLVKPASKLFQVPGIGWRGAYLILGGCSLGALLLCALFLRDQPAAPKRAPAAEGAEPAAAEGAGTMTAFEALRRPGYWTLYIYLMFNSILGSTIIALSYDFCIHLNFSSSTAFTLVGMVSAFNGISRIPFGLLYDRLGRKRMMLVGCSTVSLAAAILLAATLLGSKALAIPGLALAGFSYGYGPVLNLNLLRSFYGGKNFSLLFGVSNTRSVITSMLNPALTQLFVVTGSFALPLTIALAASGVAFLLQFRIKEPT